MPETSTRDDKTVGIHDGRATTGHPCQECPWRTANHGRRHPGGFFRKDNLRRLWNQIRKGGGMQTCHPTDPNHPDHRKYAGAKEGARTGECVGSVVLITRELRHAARLGGEETRLDAKGAERYLNESKERRGLTRKGLLWATVMRSVPPPLGVGKPMAAIAMELMDADWIGRPDQPVGQPPKTQTEKP